jgi:C4-dicarboxylate-binding protein DctP
MFTWGSGADWSASTWKNVISPTLKNLTKGQLDIKVLYPGETPYVTKDFPSAVSQGAADLAIISLGLTAGANPSLTVEDMPFLQPTGTFQEKRDMHKALASWRQSVVSKKWSYFELTTNYAGPQHLWLTKGSLDNFDSLKGKRIRTFSPELDDLIKILAGTPVSMDISEVYTSLQTGALDGLVTGITASYSNKFPEVVKIMVPIAAFRSTQPVIASNNSWNKLPKDVQDTISKYFKDNDDWYASGFVATDGDLIQQAFLQYNLSVIASPKGFREQIAARAPAEIWKNWATRQGADGMSTLDAIVNVLKGAGFQIKGYPF